MAYFAVFVLVLLSFWVGLNWFPSPVPLVVCATDSDRFLGFDCHFLFASSLTHVTSPGKAVQVLHPSVMSFSKPLKSD